VFKALVVIAVVVGGVIAARIVRDNR